MALIFGAVIVLSVRSPMTPPAPSCFSPPSPGFTAASSVLISALQGVGRLWVVSLSDATLRPLSVVGIVLALHFGGGPTSVAVAWILGTLVSLLLYFYVCIRLRLLRGPIRLSTWRGVFSGGLPFLTWDVTNKVYVSAPVLLLSLFATYSAIGWFAAANRLIAVPLFAPVVVMMCVLPELARSHRLHTERFTTLGLDALRLSVLAVVPATALFVTASSRIIALLGYGPEYSGSVPVLAILGVGAPIVAFNTMLGTMINAGDGQRGTAAIGLAAALTGPPISVVAVGGFVVFGANPALGAAIGSVVIEAAICLLMLRTREIRALRADVVSIGVRCLLATLLTIAAMAAGMRVGVVTGVLFGMGVYAFVALYLRLVTLRDVQRLFPGRIIARRLGETAVTASGHE
jgi:O-antigen/teichoic acid export membrane protein